MSISKFLKVWKVGKFKFWKVWKVGKYEHFEKHAPGVATSLSNKNFLNILQKLYLKINKNELKNNSKKVPTRQRLHGTSELPVAPVAQRYHVTSDALGREFDLGKRDFSH